MKNELCVLGKLVLCGTRIVIPRRLRDDVLHLAHEGHHRKDETAAQKQSRVAENGQ